jgi:hypothetical protein
MPIRPALPRWLVLATALGCASCSGSDSGGLHPVTGKVLHNDKPARGVVVTFHLKGADPVKAIRPVGMSGEDGTFTLATGPREGAAPGEYVATFIWPENVAPKAKKAFSLDGPESQDRLRGAYANPATSTFKVEIKEGANQLPPFSLK